MLLFLLMTTILPSTWTLRYPNPIPIDLGGRDGHAALIYPTSHPNPIPLLHGRLRNTILSAIHTQVGHIATTPELEKQIDALVEECLGRLRVTRVKSKWKDWSLAFKSLLVPLSRIASSGRVDMGGEEGGGGGMDLVVCDGFSDGFWAERWADETYKSRQRGKVEVRGSDIHIGDVMDDIARLRKDLGTVVILSVQGLWVSPLPFSRTIRS